MKNNNKAALVQPGYKWLLLTILLLAGLFLTGPLHGQPQNSAYLPIVISPAPPQEGPFELIAPSDGAQLDTLIPIMKFQVGDLPENTAGCFAISTEPYPEGCNSSFPASGGQSWEWVMWYNLDPDTTYYWRVAAVYNYDYDHKEWGDQWTLTTGPAGSVILPPPTLLAPTDGAAVSADSLTLQWTAVEGAVEYTVRIRDEDTDRGFSNSGITSPEVGPESLSWIFNMTDGTHFGWYVNARNDYAWGDYSDYWHFSLYGQSSLLNAGASSTKLLQQNAWLETIQGQRVIIRP